MHQSQRTAWRILTYVYNHVTICQIKISKVLSNFSTFPPPTRPVATTGVFSVTMSLFLFCLFVCFVFWSHIGVKSYGLWLTLVSTIPKYIEIQVWSGGGANRRVLSWWQQPELEVMAVTKLFHIRSDATGKCWGLYPVLASWPNVVERSYGIKSYFLLFTQLWLLLKEMHSLDIPTENKRANSKWIK